MESSYAFHSIRITLHISKYAVANTSIIESQEYMSHKFLIVDIVHRKVDVSKKQFSPIDVYYKL